MWVTHEELIHYIKTLHPEAKHGQDFFVAMPVSPTGPEQTGQAFIAQWNIPDANPPSVEEIENLHETFGPELEAFRGQMTHLRKMVPISARQLWLMALDIGVTKQMVLDALETWPDPVEAEYLKIEVTEPPMEGYDRFSPAVETFRELMEIPAEQFDDLWAWAAGK